MSKNSYEEVRNFINNQEYQLLSTEYVNNKQKLKLKCPHEHIFYVRYDNFKSGSRCPVCHGNIKLSYNEVKKYIESHEYQLLSTEYVNFHSKLKIECPIGHEFNMTFANFKNNHRCPMCYGTPKHDIEYIKSFLYSINYQLASKEYKNNKDKLKIICDKNHIFNMSFNSIITGRRCPIC